MRRQIARAIAAAAVIGFVLMPSPAGAGGGGHCPDPPPAAEAGQVVIIDSCFAPQDLPVSTGQTVRWDMKGSALHTVTFGSLNSGDVVGSFSARFNRPGTYDYQCLYHPGMQGTISVTGPVVGDNAIEPLSEIRSVSGSSFANPIEIAGTKTQPAGQKVGIQRVELHIGVAGGLLIAAGLVLVALVSAAGATIAVRLARR